MRRLSVTLLAALVVVPAALAARGAAGDGALSVVSASGSVTVSAKGTIYGQIDKGSLTVTDPDPTDGTVQVNGAEYVHPADSKVTVYTGKDLSFRLVGGKYTLVLKGSGIDFVAVGVGKAWLKGSTSAPDPGTYSVNGGKKAPLPLAPAAGTSVTSWSGLLVPFGTPSSTTPAP